jgi:hypothetical protein
MNCSGDLPVGSFPVGVGGGREGALPRGAAFALLAIWLLHSRINRTGPMMCVDGGKPEVAGRDLNGAFEADMCRQSAIA